MALVSKWSGVNEIQVKCLLRVKIVEVTRISTQQEYAKGIVTGLVS